MDWEYPEHNGLCLFGVCLLRQDISLSEEAKEIPGRRDLSQGGMMDLLVPIMVIFSSGFYAGVFLAFWEWACD
jgi:hypothetical protein